MNKFRYLATFAMFAFVVSLLPSSIANATGLLNVAIVDDGALATAGIGTMLDKVRSHRRHHWRRSQRRRHHWRRSERRRHHWRRSERRRHHWRRSERRRHHWRRSERRRHNWRRSERRRHSWRRSRWF